MQYVLITGASTGIGYHILKDLHQKGYFVFGSVRKTEDAERLQEEFPDHCMPLLFDVTDGAAIAAAQKKVAEVLQGQPLMALINNAGIANSGPLQYIPVEKIRQQFEINVVGVLQVTQAFLPMLGAKKGFTGKPGRIINISSVSGRITSPFTSLYSASKFALEALTDGLRRELKPFGVEALTVQPGPIKTPIWNKARGDQELYLDTEYREVFAGIDRFLEKVQNDALPPEAVTKTVYRALTADTPKTRYLVAKKPGLLRFISNFVPARIVDRLTLKMLENRLK